MNKKQQLVAPLLALLVTGSAFAHGGFVKDSAGNIVKTSYGCLRTTAYTDEDAAECPLNKKPMATMVKPKPKPAPVAVMKPKPKPAPVVVKSKPKPAPVIAKPKPAPVVVSAPAPKPTPVLKKVINLEGVNFETGSNRLTGGSLNTLDSLAQELKANPGTQIVVEGHTDDRGDSLMNKKLSQARAETVRDHLIAQGVSENSLSAVGIGEARAIASNDTSAGRAKNRRVELRISE